MTYSKSDVQWHADGMGPSKPAVNVKVHTWPLLSQKALNRDTDPEFTIEWVEKHLSDDDMEHYFRFACEASIEMLQEDAYEIFGPWAKLWQEGRSGGWVVVEKITDIDDWDAIQLGKWRHFERYAHEYVAEVPAEMLELIELNEFQPWQAKRDADEADDAAAELPILASV